MRGFAPAVALLTALTIELGVSPAQAPDDFSITLQRTGCLGSCPDYEVTILRDGKVKYRGQAYVGITGLRERAISETAVQRLARRLEAERFFEWDETDRVCLDLPEVHITANAGGRSKHVLEGCKQPGKILALAKEIDRAAGTQRWVKLPLVPNHP